MEVCSLNATVSACNEGSLEPDVGDFMDDDLVVYH